MTFTAPAILTRVSFLKDGGLSLGFSTQELKDEEKLAVSKFHNKYGWLLFKENEFKDEEIPDKPAPVENGKTPSQRLHAVLYIWWRQRGARGSFNDFYAREIEKLIDKIKEQLT